MPILVDMPPELESELIRVATEEGVDLPTFLREAAAARLRSYNPARLLTEADLLSRISKGFSEEFWMRYRQLIAKRNAETMTDEEQQEVVAMSDRLEAWRVERLQYLIKLAETRDTSVDALIQEMGLRPAPVE